MTTHSVLGRTVAVLTAVLMTLATANSVGRAERPSQGAPVEPTLSQLSKTAQLLEDSLDELDGNDFKSIQAFVEQHCHRPVISDYWLCLNGE